MSSGWSLVVLSDTPTPTPTASGLNEASASLETSVGSAYGLSGLLIILVYIIAALLAAQFIAPWLAQSDFLKQVSSRLVESLEYAIKGVAATAVLIVAALPLYGLATAGGSTRGLALKTIAIAAVGYIALVGIGALADRAVSAFIEAHPDVDEWGDLFPEETEDDQPAVTDGGDPDG